MGNAFETFIQECGSVKKAAKVLGLDREHVSAMRRGLNSVNLIYALEIQKYMHEKHDTSVQIMDLVSPRMKYRLKNLSLPCMEEPIKLINISLNSVKYSPPNLSCPKKVFTNLSQLRPIILDENKQLVANKSAYLLYKLQDKKTIPAWQISLPDLLARKYLPSLLAQTFLICERAAIGIAAKKYLGNRQGPRIRKQFCRNFDEIKGRTDQLLASLLGFGSKDNYRQAEKVHLLGNDELIEIVNKKQLSIFTGAQLARFTHKKQQKILMLNKKEIPNFIYRFKRRYKK